MRTLTKSEENLIKRHAAGRLSDDELKKRLNNELAPDLVRLPGHAFYKAARQGKKE